MMNIYTSKNFWISLIVNASSWICNLKLKKTYCIYNKSDAGNVISRACIRCARACAMFPFKYLSFSWVVSSACSSTSAASWLELRGRLSMRRFLSVQIVVYYFVARLFLWIDSCKGLFFVNLVINCLVNTNWSFYEKESLI